LTGSGDTVIAGLQAGHVYVCSLRVTDEDGEVSFDEMRITVVSRPPTATANGTPVVGTGGSVLLRGAGEDNAGVIIGYAWKVGSENWTSSEDGRLLFTAPAQAGMLVCSLRVTDDDGEVGYDTLLLRVQQPCWQAQMRRVPSKDSTFVMGSDSSIYSNEKPAHQVRFTYNFRLDTTEVTQGDYRQLMAQTYDSVTLPPWDTDAGRGTNIPAYFVSWYNAALYCNARSKRDGLDTVYRYTRIEGTVGRDCELIELTGDLDVKGYRLPTEAEWEYACRARSTTEYFWGDYPNSPSLDKYVWYADNGDSTAHPVAQKLPNRFGLYDMNGNVWEWCNDWHDTTYVGAAGVDPMGPSPAPQFTERSTRGGGWKYGQAANQRSATRSKHVPENEGNGLGFRVALRE
jgi:formylglycine-generating enzyme required for sulfatase activity